MEKVVNSNPASFYKGKKVFVTGHTGFKGAWLICYLHLLGAVIKGYALEPETEDSLFNTISSRFSFKNVIADIRDYNKLEKELLDFQPDVVFHLAAQALVRRSYEIPAETFDVNVTGTANLLEAVSKLSSRCSVVIITTDKVYRNEEKHYHYKETDILGGHDPYSASKAAAEIVVESFRNSFFSPSVYSVHQKAIASARAGNVIGGGDWSKDRIIPDIVRSLTSAAKIDVRNPDSVRPWQHVLEPLAGYLKLAMLLNSDPVKYSGAFNFGPAEKDHLPVRELVDIAIKCWGEGDWSDKSNLSQLHEAGLLKLSIEKAGKVLQWHPQLGSKEAIQWTIDWYRQKKENRFDYTIEQIKKYQQL